MNKVQAIYGNAREFLSKKLSTARHHLEQVMSRENLRPSMPEHSLGGGTYQATGKNAGPRTASAVAPAHFDDGYDIIRRMDEAERRCKAQSDNWSSVPFPEQPYEPEPFQYSSGDGFWPSSYYIK